MSEILHVGLIGASRIAVEAVLSPAHQRPDVQVFGVAARSEARARDYAKIHGIPFVAPDYQSLMGHPDIDLIYIGLPPAFHADLAVRALQAGKHVLCEKPFALNAAEAKTMVDAAKAAGRQLIEGYHYRFHPLFKDILALCAQPDFGPIRQIKGHFEVPVAHTSAEFRYRPEMGGGALMDLGCYPLHWATSLMGDAEPAVLTAQCNKSSAGVDVAFSATLSFPCGANAAISCDMDPGLPAGIRASLEVISAKNRLFVINPLQPRHGARLELTGSMGDRTADYTGDTFTHQLDHVVDRLKGQATALTGGTDAVRTMHLLDQLRAKAGLPPFPRSATI